MEDFDRDFMYYVIDKKIPFPLILEKAGYENQNYHGNVYCPFHDNTDTPAGRIYKDDDGDRLYCYGECRRQYRPSDAIKKGLMDIRLGKVFHRIWNKLPEGEKDRLRNEFGQPKEDFLSDDFKSVIEDMKDFKRGWVDYREYLGLAVKAMEILQKEDEEDD